MLHLSFTLDSLSAFLYLGQHFSRRASGGQYILWWFCWALSCFWVCYALSISKCWKLFLPFRSIDLKKRLSSPASFRNVYTPVCEYFTWFDCCVPAFFTDMACTNRADFFYASILANWKKPTKGRISKEQHMHYLFISLAIVCDPLSWIIFRVLRKKDELKIWYWSRKSQSDLLPDKPVSYEAICYEDTVIFCNKNQILLVHK